MFPIGDNQKQISEIVVVAWLYALALAEWTQSRIARRWYMALAAVFVVTAVGSFSRAAWLVVALQAVGLLWLYRRTVRRYINVLLPLGVAAGVGLLPAAVYMTQLQTGAVGQSSTKHRILLTDLAIEGWRAHPLLGVGSGHYRYLELNSSRYQATYAPLLDSHGIWQKLLAENGLAGVVSFAVFAVWLSVTVALQYRTLRSSQSRRVVALLCLAALGIFLFEWFDTNFYKGKLWLPVGIAAAAPYALQYAQQRLRSAF